MEYNYNNNRKGNVKFIQASTLEALENAVNRFIDSDKVDRVLYMKYISYTRGEGEAMKEHHVMVLSYLKSN